MIRPHRSPKALLAYGAVPGLVVGATNAGPPLGMTGAGRPQIWCLWPRLRAFPPGSGGPAPPSPPSPPQTRRPGAPATLCRQPRTSVATLACHPDRAGHGHCWRTALQAVARLLCALRMLCAVLSVLDCRPSDVVSRTHHPVLPGIVASTRTAELHLKEASKRFQDRACLP